MERRMAIVALALLGIGILVLMAYMMYQSSDTAEAAAWFATGCLALREVVSKIENIALGLRLEPPLEGA